MPEGMVVDEGICRIAGKGDGTRASLSVLKPRGPEPMNRALRMADSDVMRGRPTMSRALKPRAGVNEMNRKAIITGASRGIGRGIAFCLAGEGYDVAFSYASRKEEAETVARKIREDYGRRCFVYQANLQEPGAGKALFERATDDLGGLDLLVNNAGVTYFESLQELTEESMDHMINLDFRNYIWMMNYAARYMIQHQIRGSIVNITSTRGERAYPSDGIYGALKAGLNRAIQSFALDVSEYGIRINNVAPGAIRIRTQEELEAGGHLAMGAFWDELGRRIPLGRSGQPEDVGRLVAFLASDNASYITGMTVRVDGGLILPGMPEVVNPSIKNGEWRSTPDISKDKPL